MNDNVEREDELNASQRQNGSVPASDHEVGLALAAAGPRLGATARSSGNRHHFRV